MKDSFLDISKEEKEFADALKALNDMHDCLDARYLKNTQRRKAKPMLQDMKANSHSVSLVPMHGITTAKRRAGDLGIKIGVIKNDPAEFPNFSAQALASVIEYGTAERYRTLKAAGFVTGRASTGVMPSFPWLRKSWDRNVRDFIREVEKTIEKRVQKAAK